MSDRSRTGDDEPGASASGVGDAAGHQDRSAQPARPAHPAPPAAKRRSRRARREGAPGADPTPQKKQTGEAVKASEDTDRAWGEAGATTDDNDDRLKRDVPPHY